MRAILQGDSNAASIFYDLQSRALSFNVEHTALIPKNVNTVLLTIPYSLNRSAQVLLFICDMKTGIVTEVGNSDTQSAASIVSVGINITTHAIGIKQVWWNDAVPLVIAYAENGGNN